MEEIKVGTMFAQFSRHKEPRLMQYGTVRKVFTNRNGKQERFTPFSRVVTNEYSSSENRNQLTTMLKSKSLKFDNEIPEEVRALIITDLERTKREKEKTLKSSLSQIKQMNSIMEKLKKEDPKAYFCIQDVHHGSKVVFNYFEAGEGWNINKMTMSYDTLNLLKRLSYITFDPSSRWQKSGYYNFTINYHMANLDELEIPLEMIY